MYDKQNKPNRHYCFTINNPTDDDKKQLDLLSDNVNYLIYAEETGKKEGTPHYQGYVELTNPQRFSWIKKRLKRAYLCIRKGSRTQARDYCFKECKHPIQYGTFEPDKQGKRNELISCKNMIDEGHSMYDLWQSHFSTMLRYERALTRYMLSVASRNRDSEPMTCIWIYGESGSGKSRYANDKWPSAYRKPNNKWWDGYDQQDTVIWDDFAKSDTYTYQDLLKWTDRYYKDGETKGGTIPLPYKTIVFTSIHPPFFDQQFIRRFNDGVNITPVTSLQKQ